MACNTPVVPLLSRSTLFIRGMVAQCPALRPLADLAARQDARIRLRCEHVLETMIRSMPYLPRFRGETDLRPLADASQDELRSMVVAQQESPVGHLHRQWTPSWKHEPDREVRLFGAACATILTEIYRLKREETTRAARKQIA